MHPHRLKLLGSNLKVLMFLFFVDRKPTGPSRGILLNMCIPVNYLCCVIILANLLKSETKIKPTKKKAWPTFRQALHIYIILWVLIWNIFIYGFICYLFIVWPNIFCYNCRFPAQTEKEHLLTKSTNCNPGKLCKQNTIWTVKNFSSFWIY